MKDRDYAGVVCGVSSRRDDDDAVADRLAFGILGRNGGAVVANAT